jgi:hypothetical protein
MVSMTQGLLLHYADIKSRISIRFYSIDSFLVHLILHHSKAEIFYLALHFLSLSEDVKYVCVVW